jgi:hypothetical protein
MEPCARSLKLTDTEPPNDYDLKEDKKRRDLNPGLGLEGGGAHTLVGFLVAAFGNLSSLPPPFPTLLNLRYRMQSLFSGQSPLRSSSQRRRGGAVYDYDGDDYLGEWQYYTPEPVVLRHSAHPSWDQWVDTS